MHYPALTLASADDVLLSMIIFHDGKIDIDLRTPSDTPLTSFDDDVFYWFLQKPKKETSSIYTFRKVRTIRGYLEGLSMI